MVCWFEGWIYKKGSMKLLQDGTYLCLFFLILIKSIACDKSPDTPGDRWSCTCSSPEQVSQRIVTASNCSASCECKSSTEQSSDNSWTCICLHGRFPLLAAKNNPSCFTTCNCNSGSSFSVEAPREFISSKATVILLSICVVFALAFVVSVICYVRQKEKLRPSTFLSDEESSHNSATNLIGRHSPIALLESKLSLCFPVKHATSISMVLIDKLYLHGIINKVVLFFKSKSGSDHGTIVRFSFSDLEHATNRFSDSNLIGIGASSNVYRGHLKDGRTIAVKRITNIGNYDADSIFLTEIKIIARLHHYHVVPLIGYSSETVGRQTERLLVFEFMAKGNLRECLDASSGKYLDWKTRVTIALGAARGLEYLHEAAAPRILHRDVKSTNILLDENWRPKITDLGMAKQLRADGFTSCCSSPARIQGTFGYFAPEYAIVGKASLKSDVFSFGVVLLELITGRKPIYISNTNREESLFSWAAPRLQNSMQVVTELPDPHLEGNFPVEEMQIMAYLAKECLLLDPDSRPSMTEVVQILGTLAPNIAERRNMTINLFQNIFSHGIKDKADTETGSKETNIEDDAESLNELPKGVWSQRSTGPLCVDRVGTLNNSLTEGNFSPSEYLRTLISLTSSNKTCHVQHGEENVDLTEPRFESFCMHSGDQSKHKLHICCES